MTTADRTLVICKPDAIERRLVGEIVSRLERKGLVASELGEPTAERGGRAKRYFGVTAKGIREVRDTQRTLMNLWQRLPQLKGRTT